MPYSTDAFPVFSMIASSTVVSGVVAALVSLRSTATTVRVENITKERQKWREKVRELALCVHKAATSSTWKDVEELRLQFSLILNPLDAEDRRIVAIIGDLAHTPHLDATLLELRDRVSLLLKHDWERVKLETRFWKLRRRVRRVPFVELSARVEAS
jgi:hypothetical protein